VTDLSTPPGAAPKTIRAMLEEHRKNPTCNMCHGVIEPNGLPLERFTVTGSGAISIGRPMRPSIRR